MQMVRFWSALRHWLEVKVSMTYISQSSDFALYLEDYLMYVLWNNESVWPDVWPRNTYSSLWHKFHGPVILPYILDWCMNIIGQDYESVWLTFDLRINIGHCDLYSMVQWLCLISWRLFDTWTLYFGIMRRYDPVFDLKINVCYCDQYFMV